MVVLLVLIGLFFYFIPFIVGYNKTNSAAIFMLNLFLGWTLIGWVVALVWAMTNDDDSKKVEGLTAATPLDEIKKLRDLLNNGSITQAEYDTQKKKILGE